MIRFIWSRLGIWIIFQFIFWLVWGLLPYFVDNIPKFSGQEIRIVVIVSALITAALVIDTIRLKKRV